TLDLSGRQGGSRARIPAASLSTRTCVITIAFAVLRRVRGRHGGTTRDTMQQTLQQGPRMVPCYRSAAPAMLAQMRLYLFPHGHVDDGRMLALVDFVLMLYLADIEDIGQQFVQARLGEGATTPRSALATCPALVDPAASPQFLHHRPQRLVLQVKLEDCPHEGRLLLVDDQLL